MIACRWKGRLFKVFPNLQAWLLLGARGPQLKSGGQLLHLKMHLVWIHF